MKIAVAMSGGVDSSVAAAILLEEGHEIIGVTMHHFDNAEFGFGKNEGSELAIQDAKENSLLNNIDNTLFYAGDMKLVLNDNFA